ncbi:glycosyltransferase [Tianweitania sp. BSSL-BM11]|uniref:Glycosyltransferase n=1 Tax=Tianweitania aestuarii TaxID=2814886 RepID=A0ABS5RT12_9HYPH|nr:glycosyltransferase [Tianweitania aestuarii]MBS9719462.1 glycosyltransferase [Tianweitania aestuarii]
MGQKPRIVSLVGAYWPGNDASGPNQSFRALAQALSSQFDFHLLARDRPFNGKAASPVSPVGSSFDATYLQPGTLAPQGLLREIRRLSPDMVWLNGFFDREFTLPVLLAKHFGRLGDVPVLLSPRGEFHPAALRLKPTRKRSYLSLVQALRLLDGVTLHATNEAEAQIIRTVLPRQSQIAIAPNIRPLLEPLPHETSPTLRLAFLGRITSIKNLAFALRVLQDVQTPVQFDIHGPIEDEDYWQMCLAMAAELPDHVGVTHQGPYANADLPAMLSHTDLLFSPTAGENFGHAIFEALSCGVPALISDRTPWRDLAAAQAGWDLPITGPETFAETIDRFATMDESARSIWRQGARKRAEATVADSDAVARSRALLEGLCA